MVFSKSISIVYEGKTKKGLLVGIIGTGNMGMGLAELFLNFGFRVILLSRSENKLAIAKQKILKNLRSSSTKKKYKDILANIKFVIEIKELKNTDLIIEAIIEKMSVKKKLFRHLSEICSENTIFATNTSSLSISDISSEVIKPQRFIGMHFFNPVSKMQLIEIIVGKKTARETVEYIKSIAIKVGKIPIVTKDSPGFIVNRLLLIFINEAAYEVYESLAPKLEIDRAVKLGLRHPMGPLAIADLIGIDICLQILEYLFIRFKSIKYKPCPLLYEMVKRGELGRKTNKGFYDYLNNSSPELLNL